MPSKEGRTGKPGNDTSYKSIDIATSNPGLLQPGSGSRSPRPPASAGNSSVPSWSKGKANNKDSGLMKKSY